MPSVAKHAWPASAPVLRARAAWTGAAAWHCLGASNAWPPLHPTCRRRRRTRTCTTTCPSPSCTTRCAPRSREKNSKASANRLPCICRHTAAAAAAAAGAHPARCLLAAPHPCTPLIGSSPNKLQDAETDLARIVGFEVEPHSIAHKYDGEHRLYAHALPPTGFKAALCRCMIDPDWLEGNEV